MLYGRDEECAVVDRLVAAAREGRSGALVIRGEPGVGKSALLGHAAESAGDMRLLHATGVESEVSLPFGGLHQLLRPVLGHVDDLPAHQRAALRGAVGLDSDRPGDGFLVAAAGLALLAEAADERPVLCLVDDAHWLDQASAEALGFVARRLEEDAVVLLLATRDRALAGMPELLLTGLDAAAATTLLAASFPDLDPQLRDRIIAESNGNPLALTELAGGLTPGQRAAKQPVTGPLPLTERIQAAFFDQVRRLPDATQRLLQVAAADDTGDSASILRAARVLGVAPDALAPAERARLVRVDAGGMLSFRHPLVRAAIYQGATFAERVASHRALAQALDNEYADRRAWHLAAAAIAPDDGLADQLEDTAEQARRRGALVTAATALERAARLSTDSSWRTRRLVAAAQDAVDAGQADQARTLLRRAEPLTDPALWARAAGVQSAIDFDHGAYARAGGLLVRAAREIAGADPATAMSMLFEAAAIAVAANDQEGCHEAANALTWVQPDPGSSAAAYATLIAVWDDFLGGDVAQAVAGARLAIEAFTTGDRDAVPIRDPQELLGTTGAAFCVGDYALARERTARLIAEYRARGMAARLSWGLVRAGLAEMLTGRHASALATATEGLRLAHDLGQDNRACQFQAALALLAAVKGDRERCHELVEAALPPAERHGLNANLGMANWALGLLDLGTGRPEQALDILHRLVNNPPGGGRHHLAAIWPVPDLVEAAVRAGRPDRAREAFAYFETWATHCDRPGISAVVRRCRALLAADTEPADIVDDHYQTALKLHAHAERSGHTGAFDRARTQLVYGEWLRRSRQRVQARHQLSAALAVFDQLGAACWAERTAAELRATGQTVPKRDPSALGRLTPQELQIIRLAMRGSTNREIATQLFLSPRTVAFHLYNAYPKLGVASRTELSHLDLKALTS